MRFDPWLARVLALAIVTIGCSAPEGRDAGTEEDAGSEEDAGTWAPTPIMEAAAPRFACPDGWSEALLEGGVSVCDPWGGAPRATCVGASAHFPGDVGCSSIGTACPADGLPADVPADAIFVSPGASGDGSRSAPFGTIAEALAAVADGGTVAIGVGTHVERLTVIDRIDVRFVGACPEAVIAPASFTGAVFISGSRVEITNLTVRATGLGLLTRMSEVVLSDVLFEGRGLTTAISASWDSDVDARNIIVRDAQGSGFNADGSVGRLDHFAFEGLGDRAFGTYAGNLSVRDGVVDSVGDSIDSIITVFAGATIILEEVVIESSSLADVVVGDDSTLRWEDVIFRASGTSPSARYGITGMGGASIDLSRVLIEGGSALGVGVGDAGSVLRAIDLVIRDMRPLPEPGSGHAIEVNAAASAELDRVWIEGAEEVGLLVTGSAAVANARDLTIVSTRSNSGGLFGRGIQVQQGGSLTVERLRLADNHEVAVVVATPGSSMIATDVIIERTDERGCASAGCPPGGIGLSVFQSGMARLERFRVRGNALIGVQVAFDGQLTLFDGEVSDNPIGANVQVPDYDLGRLNDRVLYRDNGINLDSTDLRIPDPTVPSG